MKFVFLFYAVLFVLFTWPFITLTNRVEPVIWGVPFFVFYCYAVGILGAISNIFVGWKFVKDPVSDEGETE